MPAKVCGSYEELVAAVEAVVPKILTGYVADVAEDILLKHIVSDVYGVDRRSPNGWFGSMYQRRHSLENSIDSFMETPDTLAVTTQANPATSIFGGSVYGENGGFLQLLESGDLGFLNQLGKSFPRPVVANAQSEISSSSAINAALQRGIQSEIG